MHFAPSSLQQAMTASQLSAESGHSVRGPLHCAGNAEGANSLGVVLIVQDDEETEAASTDSPDEADGKVSRNVTTIRYRACNVGWWSLAAALFAVAIAGTGGVMIWHGVHPLPSAADSFQALVETAKGACAAAEFNAEFLFEETLNSSNISFRDMWGCCTQCLATQGCRSWTWVGNSSKETCKLKGGFQLGKRFSGNSVSGLMASTESGETTRLMELRPVNLQGSPVGALLSKLRSRLASNLPQLRKPFLPQLQPSFSGPSAPLQMEPDRQPVLGMTSIRAAPYPTMPPPQDFGAPCAAGVGNPLPVMPNYNTSGFRVQLKILTYNLFWWNLMDVRHSMGGAPFKLIEKHGKPRQFDLMAFQECEDPDRVVREAGLASEYIIFGGLPTKTTAICIAFWNKTWSLLEQGIAFVTEDSKQQYFGRRAAQWIRLRHRDLKQTVFFMNHHGPLPINSGGKCGGVTTAQRLLTLIQEHAQPGDGVILAGDFNANERSPTIGLLSNRLHRAFWGSALGGIDNIFTNMGDQALIDSQNLGNGGSDHDALSVVLEMDGKPPPKEVGLKDNLMRFFKWLMPWM